MKKIIIFFLFCFFITSNIVSAETLNYTNLENHYSFTLPSGWREIRKSTIDEKYQNIAKQAGTKYIEYVAGFQPQNVLDFQYPYFLVQEHKIDTPSLDQIVQAFKSDNFTGNVGNVADKYSEYMTNASLQEPFVDKERNILFISFEMDVINVGKVKTLAVMFLGKKNIIQLNFNSLDSQYSEYLPIFNEIINTFKFEKGFEYNPEEAKKNDTPSFFESTFEKIITTAITGVSVFLVLKMLSRSKNRKSKKNK